MPFNCGTLWRCLKFLFSHIYQVLLCFFVNSLFHMLTKSSQRMESIYQYNYHFFGNHSFLRIQVSPEVISFQSEEHPIAFLGMQASLQRILSTFVYLKNVPISPSCFMDIFAEFRIPGWQLYPFRTLNRSFHCLLTFIIPG